MSTTRNQSNRTSNARGKKPTHIAYVVQEREGQKAFWQKIGGAWQHGDGQGFSVQLSAFPLDGRITLRVATESDKKKNG